MKTLGGVVSLLSFLAVGCGAAEVDAEGFEEAVLTQQAGPASGGVDLSGTWGARVKTVAKISAPVVGASDAPLDLSFRLVVTRANGQFRADVQICSLTTDSPELKIDYAKLLPYMKQTVAEPDFEATIGGAVPIPDISFRIGMDEAGAAVDTDGDTRPGATLPIVALGLVPIQAYTGLNLKISMDATLRANELIDGTAGFSGTGQIFGSNFPMLLSSGDFSVEPSGGPTPFAAKHFAGNVPCAELLKKL